MDTINTFIHYLINFTQNLTYFDFLFWVPLVAILINIMLKAQGKNADRGDWLVCYELFLASIACLVGFYTSSLNNADLFKQNTKEIESIHVNKNDRSVLQITGIHN